MPGPIPTPPFTPTNQPAPIGSFTPDPNAPFQTTRLSSSTTPPAKILVATPSIDHRYHDDYLHAQLRLQARARDHGVTFEYNLRTLKGHSLIPIARTIMLRDFLDTDCTHILFWDSDIGAEPSTVLDLIEADKPLIGAVCVQKRYDWGAIKETVLRDPSISPEQLAAVGGVFTFATGAEGADVDVTRRDPIPVKYVGMGLTLIKRKLVELTAHHFRIATVKLEGGRPFPALFAQRIVDADPINPSNGSIWLSEDYAFCSRVNEAWTACIDDSPPCWLAWWTRTTHTGQHTFEGDLRLAGEVLGRVDQDQTP